MLDPDLPPPGGALPSRFKSNMRLSDVDTTSAWLSPPQHFARQWQEFEALVEEALNWSLARDADKRAVRIAAGLKPAVRPYGALISHRGVRQHAAKLLRRRLIPKLDNTAEPRWFFATIITDIGNSLEFAPIIELGRLQRDVWKMLDLVDFHFIGVTELKLGRFPLGSRGRTVQAHIHAIGYFDDPALTPKSAAAAISKRATLTNWLGAAVADFRPIADTVELERRCRYMFKPPLEESHFRSDSWVRSGLYTKSGNINRWGALRLVEILARLTLRQATFARGSLVNVKNDWLREVEAWCDHRPIRREPYYDAAFARVWARSAVKHHREIPIFRFDASRPLDNAWTDAMQPKIAQVIENQERFDARALDQKLRSIKDFDDL